MTSTTYETLDRLETRYENWLIESAEHSRACQLCFSISARSSTHRLARLELLH